MPHDPITATTPANKMEVVRNHEMAKEKMLDFFDMFNTQKEAVLAATSAHSSCVQEYLVTSDVEKLEVDNAHFGRLLDNFNLLMKEAQVVIDQYDFAKYLYLSAFPLGQADGWSFPDDEIQNLADEAQAPHAASILTGMIADVPSQADALI